MDLIGPYSKYIIQQHPCGATIKNNVSIKYTMMINPTTGWFKIVEILTYNLNEVKGGNDEYIDKSSTRVIQLFNRKWLSRYPRPRKVVFDNVYYF